MKEEPGPFRNPAYASMFSAPGYLMEAALDFCATAPVAGPVTVIALVGISIGMICAGAGSLLGAPLLATAGAAFGVCSVAAGVTAIATHAGIAMGKGIASLFTGGNDADAAQNSKTGYGIDRLAPADAPTLERLAAARAFKKANTASRQPGQHETSRPGRAAPPLQMNG